MSRSKNTRNMKSKMQKKRPPKDRFVSIHCKQAKSAFEALFQRPLGNILTLAVISMALTMPTCVYLLSKNIAYAAHQVTGPVEINLYLREGISESKIFILKDQFEKRADVQQVVYISPQAGLKELSQHAGFKQAISLLDDNVLPPVLVLTPATTDKASIQALVRLLKREQDVTDVRLDEDWLSRLDAIKGLATTTGISVSVLMLLAVFLIVGNTLRFNVMSSKEEIQTMKLIGATDAYILRPYLYSGMWFGLIGSFIAWLLTALLTVLLNNAVQDLAQLYDSDFRLLGLRWDESLILWMTGTLIGCFAAKLSAKRHLKEIEPV